MKLRKIIYSLGLSTALMALAGTATAGPGVQYWTRTKPITTTKDAEAVKPDDTLVMTCAACKTVMVRAPSRVGPSTKGHQDWVVVGSKHSCDHCGGEITVVNGKTSGSMQHNCSKCGDDAASCCVAVKEDKKS